MKTLTPLLRTLMTENLRLLRKPMTKYTMLLTQLKTILSIQMELL